MDLLMLKSIVWSCLNRVAHRVGAVARLSLEIGTAKSIEAMGGSEADVPELAQPVVLTYSLLDRANLAKLSQTELFNVQLTIVRRLFGGSDHN